MSEIKFLGCLNSMEVFVIHLLYNKNKDYRQRTYLFLRKTTAKNGSETLNNNNNNK